MKRLKKLRRKRFKLQRKALLLARLIYKNSRWGEWVRFLITGWITFTLVYILDNLVAASVLALSYVYISEIFIHRQTQSLCLKHIWRGVTVIYLVILLYLLLILIANTHPI